jgi:hypothetical protein
VIQLIEFIFLFSNKQTQLNCSMETQGEELSRLRAENASSKQLLASKDAQLTSNAALLACKDDLLASRAAELQRCNELLQYRVAAPEPFAGAADSCKRQRLHYSSTAESPLDRDDILDHVFSFVGGGDHLYIGGVSRRWRGRYMRHCVQTSASKFSGKLVTRHRNVLMTESRLQLALSSGLTVADWNLNKQQYALQICQYSLEPEKVITLLREHGVPWSTELCNGAVYFNKLALLQWLHSHSCAWDEGYVLQHASMGGSVAMLEWLSAVTSPWTTGTMVRLLHCAGLCTNLPAAQWLRARGAEWPKAFVFGAHSNAGAQQGCWNVAAVKWAQASGAGWLTWKCEDYTADIYEHAKLKLQATDVLEWAHANGCPCTCGFVQQQQQQQH